MILQNIIDLVLEQILGVGYDLIHVIILLFIMWFLLSLMKRGKRR